MKYTTFSEDPIEVRHYVLENGLQVYLSKNTLEPQIYTHIAVKAGHSFDPKNNTGLAHYLEHLMFKGTSKIGSLDWEKEKVLLKKIAYCYEKHKKTKNPQEKQKIYTEIDQLSGQAAQYAAAGEYDQLLTHIGAQNTNAYTSFEETVYKNLIPSNALEKWLMIESERFGELVLRLFHTELETVYEEFNMGQDRDESKEWKTLLKGLFPSHPYGTQTTIGEAEHLKNPSMEAIHHYFDHYYVPNNMAIILSGDLDYDQTIDLIQKYFGAFKKKENFFAPVLPQEEPLKKVKISTVYGPQAERVSWVYRLPKADSRGAMIADLFHHLLTVSAGIFELNLNYPQKLQYVDAHLMTLRDYSVHIIQAFPKAGQTLEQVKNLVLQEIEKVKKGEFDSELLKAIIKNATLSFQQHLRQNAARVAELTKAYIQGYSWQDALNYYQEMSTISPEELIDFVKENYHENYVMVYKKQGEDLQTVKVEKPQITPLTLQTESSSWAQNFYQLEESLPIQPVFADFSLIKSEILPNGLELVYNEDQNPLTKDVFTLTYLFQLGQWVDKKMAFAFFYAGFLGTEKYTHHQLKTELFKNALNLSFYDTADHVYLVISGHKDSLAQGIAFANEIFSNLKPDAEALENAVNYLLQERENQKKQKENIFSRLAQWSIYGENAPARDLLSETELKQLKADELVNYFKQILTYRHQIIYRGNDFKQAKPLLLTQAEQRQNLKNPPEAKKYEVVTSEEKTFFVEYDMVQVNVGWTRKDQLFSVETLPYAEVFDAYFGSGLSSIVFQEIREAQSLAYRAYSSYGVAQKQGYYNIISAFIGTQPDKLEQAIASMNYLLNHLPEKNQQFEQAKANILKNIATQRIQPEDLFWYQERLKKRGITEDIRKIIYKNVEKMTFKDFEIFFNSTIYEKKFNLLLMGQKKVVDLHLKSKGSIEIVTLETLFNY